MTLSQEYRDLLVTLMRNSARKGNLANSGLVLENDKMIASAESWVISDHDATAHSERMLVEMVCKLKHSNYTPGLTMVTVIEPCLMCMSACAWAGYKEIAYIIPAKKYLQKLPWMAETTAIDKKELGQSFSDKLAYIQLKEYEQEFCKVFEEEMKELLK